MHPAMRKHREFDIWFGEDKAEAKRSEDGITTSE